MEQKEYQDIVDYMQFQGFDYPDFKPFLQYLDAFVNDFEFTEEVILMLVSKQFNIGDITFEDKEEYKQYLIKMVEAI